MLRAKARGVVERMARMSGVKLRRMVPVYAGVGFSRRALEKESERVSESFTYEVGSRVGIRSCRISCRLVIDSEFC